MGVFTADGDMMLRRRRLAPQGMFRMADVPKDGKPYQVEIAGQSMTMTWDAEKGAWWLDPVRVSYIMSTMCVEYRPDKQDIASSCMSCDKVGTPDPDAHTDQTDDGTTGDYNITVSRGSPCP